MPFSRCGKWILCALLLCVGTARDATAGILTLQWDPSQDSSVTGYMVFVGTESGQYTATFNVGNQIQFVFRDAQPGLAYYFSVAAYRSGGIVGPLSTEVSGRVDVSLRLSNPGDLTNVVGAPASVQLAGSAATADALTYAASGLPPGLAIDGATGLIAGTPTTEGTYRATATVSSGASVASESFVWTVERRLPETPVVTLTLPVSGSKFTTSDPSVVIGGTAVDDHGVTAVSWTSDRVGSGQATGTDVWMAAVPLRPGKNDITITAMDGSSNRSRIRLSIYRKVLPRWRPPSGMVSN